jgi:hypothetical protein
MKILEKEITSKGFKYVQLLREDKFAIYEQSKKGHDVKKYEVIIIDSHNGYEIGGQQVLPSEMYPSSTLWGVKGFTMESYDEALKKIKTLKKKQAAKDNKEK